MIERARHPSARTRLRSERGMTMIEVTIAMLILTIGALSVASLISAQARNTYRSEQSQVVSDRLQAEMEKIKDLSYDQIALTGIPTDTGNTADPRWRVSGSSYATADNGTNLRALVYNGSALTGGGTVSGGAISSAPQSFTSGDVHGTIYRFVTWEDDATCPATDCPGTQDLKRVIVAVWLDTTAPGGTRQYQELQSQVFDPNANGSVDLPDCEGDCDHPEPWLFFLTDTTCDNTERQPIVADHLVHNTNGACSTGLRNSSHCTTTLGITNCPPGSPDLMFTQAPPLAGESPLFDYATDVEPTVDPTLDKGLQMPKPSTNGCLSSLFQPLTNVLGALIGDPSASRMQEIHKWVSPRMGGDFNVTISSSEDPGTLNLWTKTINGETYTGRICIWIFERHLNALGVPIDTPAVFPTSGLTYFTYQPPGGVWPQTWQELHITLPFNLNVNLGPNSRLGLALQVERSGTSGDGLQFMYDEPSFDSRLEVKTSSLLPF